MMAIRSGIAVGKRSDINIQTFFEELTCLHWSWQNVRKGVNVVWWYCVTIHCTLTFESVMDRQDLGAWQSINIIQCIYLNLLLNIYSSYNLWSLSGAAKIFCILIQLTTSNLAVLEASSGMATAFGSRMSFLKGGFKSWDPSALFQNHLSFAHRDHLLQVSHTANTYLSSAHRDRTWANTPDQPSDAASNHCAHLALAALLCLRTVQVPSRCS